MRSTELWRWYRRIGRRAGEQTEADVSKWIQAFLTHECSWPENKLLPQRRMQPRGPVDFELVGWKGGRLLIEIKSWMKPLKRQMIEKYLTAPGIPTCVGLLTNGADWELWLSGTKFRKLGIRMTRLRTWRLTGAEDSWVNEIHRNTIRRTVQEGICSSSEVVTGIVRSDSDVQDAATDAYNELFTRGGSHRVLKQLALGYPRAMKRDYRVPPEWMPWVAALQSRTVIKSLRFSIRALLGTRRRPPSEGIEAAIKRAFPLPGSESLD